MGYTFFLVEDATSAINADLQVWETRMLNQIYCKVVSTDEVLQDLAAQLEAVSSGLRGNSDINDTCQADGSRGLANSGQQS